MNELTILLQLQREHLPSFVAEASRISIRDSLFSPLPQDPPILGLHPRRMSPIINRSAI